MVLPWQDAQEESWLKESHLIAQVRCVVGRAGMVYVAECRDHHIFFSALDFDRAESLAADERVKSSLT